MFYQICDSRYKQIITIGKRQLTFINQEWKHTPVDQIGAITLGRIAIGNICPAAQHFLTGSGLLSGRTVTWLHREDRASYSQITFSSFWIYRMDRIHDRFQFFHSFQWAGSCLNRLLCFLNLFCSSYISRIFTGQGELCQSQRIGTIRRGLSRRDQLICGGYRIMDLRYHFQDQILRQSAHGRPVLDIRAKMNLHTRICHTVAVKYAILIDLAVEEIFRITEFHIQIRCCCQITFIGCGCCDGSGIHQCH